MWTVHQRIAELFLISKKRPLTESEETEFIHCMEANANRAYKLASLYNLSLIASMINNITWQHELCKEIEEINNPG